MKKSTKVLLLCIGTVLLIVLIIVIPIIISNAYEKKWGYAVLWGVEDTLSYYGNVLSTIGSMFIGSVAVWQAFKLNEEAKNREKLTEQLEKYRNSPILDCKCQGVSTNTISVALYNRSGFTAYNIKVEEAILKQNDRIVNIDKTDILYGTVLCAGKDLSIIFNSKENIEDALNFEFKLVCQSAYPGELKYHITSISYDKSRDQKFIYECKLE